MRVGPDGKQQKTSLDPPANAQPEGGRLKKRIVENKKEEHKDYADQMKTLAQQYVRQTRISCSKPINRQTSRWVRSRRIPKL